MKKNIKLSDKLFVDAKGRLIIRTFDECYELLGFSGRRAEMPVIKVKKAA
ncbi:MAG TPA: hypothetical protein VMU29_12120 [Smithella sp.]|nr:hypothetical protein [Smithella sp.]